jgi:hypothetical protein
MNWMQGNFGGRFAKSSETAPLARKDELVVEDLAGDAGAVDEVLIYDQRTDQAHCLTREAAMVWRVCDGKTKPAELAAALSLDLDVVTRAIEELAACDLLDAGVPGGMTRREATLRMAKVGGAAAAAPLIYSILAPTPALASSQNFCVNLGCDVVGCGTCHQAGCSCCGPASNTISGTKLCTADCTTTNCNATIRNQHCAGQDLSSPSCN